jgi:hypothetical protein
MDLNGFREAQSPWFFTQPPTEIVEIRNRGLFTKPQAITQPTKDSKYPEYAAPMADGRTCTDYRGNCEANIPTGMQYASRRFMQRNADELMGLARKKQAEAMGAGRSYDITTVMPPSAYVTCDASLCRTTLAQKRGVGVERREHLPALFGTFAENYPTTKRSTPLTQVEEGGRNSRRSG